MNEKRDSAWAFIALFLGIALVTWLIIDPRVIIFIHRLIFGY